MAESQKAPLALRGICKVIGFNMRRPLPLIWLVLGGAMVLFPASPVGQVGLMALGGYIILLFCAMFGAGWAATTIRLVTPFVPVRPPEKGAR